MAIKIAVALVIILVVLVLLRLAYQLLEDYVWKPRRITRFMAKQGISGPRRSFLVGNLLEIAKLRENEDQSDMKEISHDIVGRLLPHYVKFSQIYGKQFLLWWGTEPRLAVFEPEMIKDVLSSKNNHRYGRSAMQQRGNRDFIGRGLLMANGQDWVQQRRIIAPAFHFDKIKGHVKYVVECTAQMLDSVDEEMERKGEGGLERDVGDELNKLAADIIARTEFGSSYDKGRRIFQQLNSLQKLSSQSAKYLCIPGSRFLPTSYNREIKYRKREVERDLMEIIQARRDSIKVGRSESYGYDLLGLMLAEAERSTGLSNQQLMDECKTFFFTGHETTALLMTWTMMLLACNPQWQQRARQEAIQICASNAPSAADLSKFKILEMVLKESLRLYTPASPLPRECLEEVKIGNLRVPKGMSVWIPALAVHHSKELWGDDAHEFKPERFAEGVGMGDKRTMKYLPFSWGPRVCVGQNFAMMEAKVVLAMILCRFRFSLSPNYRHSPVCVLTVRPKHGVPIVFERL